MKRIILIAAMAVASVAASAQNFTFGYVDFTELTQLTPKADSARVAIEENQKMHEEILVDMYEEYQAMTREYQQKAQSWTPAARESKEREIMDKQSRIEQSQQDFQMELQQLQQNFQAELFAAAQDAVTQLAKAKGVSVVFDKNSLLYLDPAQGVDLGPEARVMLNIPEGRTLAALQAELQAKAQAARAGMGR